MVSRERPLLHPLRLLPLLQHDRQLLGLRVCARLAVGSAFLSAVADRFGLWGAPGSANASWGDFAHFLAYAAKVNRFLPAALIPAVGWVATAAELSCGIGILIPGRANRWFALASGVLLALFGLGMATGTGIKSALNYSVFTASCAAFLLAAVEAAADRDAPP